jgi:hypothetical protein
VRFRSRFLVCDCPAHVDALSIFIKSRVRALPIDVACLGPDALAGFGTAMGYAGSHGDTGVQNTGAPDAVARQADACSGPNVDPGGAAGQDLAADRQGNARHKTGTGARTRRRAVSDTHLVLIPSFNTGVLLAATVTDALACWAPVWVVVDGSTDDSAAAIDAIARTEPGLRVLRLARNQGKGAAVRHGLAAAQAEGFTHALVMDADGQHPAAAIEAFMAASAASPQALVMGQPLFGTDAPWIRVVSRRLSNGCAVVMTGRRVGDTLFGFRVYPIAALLSVMQASSGMRRFDFDPEAVIRLAWQGIRLIHLPTPVRYPSRVEGGVSHFDYVRDNLLLIRMYLRLGLAAIRRLHCGDRRGGGDARQ